MFVFLLTVSLVLWPNQGHQTFRISEMCLSYLMLISFCCICRNKVSPQRYYRFGSRQQNKFFWFPYSSTLTWKIPWTEEPGGLQSMRSLRVRHDWTTSLSLSCIGEGNGNPLQCSCLGNPRDGRAWLAAVYGVAQSRTQLKRLSSSSSSSLPL